MAKSRKGNRKRRNGHNKSPRRRSDIRIRPRPDVGPQAVQIVHPRCALERAEDLAEVHRMLEAGEGEIAKDELRWLLEGCGDAVDIHQLLGELAYEEGDRRLARGHYGYAYDIVLAALPGASSGVTLPYAIEENRAFLRSAIGLAKCLWELDKPGKAKKVLRAVLRWDATDPLRATELLQLWLTGAGATHGDACGESGARS